MKDAALGSKKTEEDVFSLGGSILDLELRSDNGQIAMATTVNQIPSDDTNGFAPGAKIAFKSGDFCEVYVNRGDADACRFVKETAVRAEQEIFTVVHNANIEAVTGVKQLAHYLGIRGGGHGLGAIGYSNGGSGLWTGNEGSFVVAFSLPGRVDTIDVTDDSAVLTSQFSRVYFRPLPDGRGELISNLGASAPFIQFKTAIGQTELTVNHDPDAATTGEPLYVGSSGGTPILKVGSIAGSRLITAQGQSIKINAGSIGGSDKAVYVRKSSPTQFLSADIGTGDVEIETMEALDLLQDTHVLPTQLYFYEAGDENQRILHASPYLQHDLRIELLGSDRVIDVIFNLNAASIGVPLYVNPSSGQIEADIPSESDAQVWTSDNRKVLTDIFIPEPPSL